MASERGGFRNVRKKILQGSAAIAKRFPILKYGKVATSGMPSAARGALRERRNARKNSDSRVGAHRSLASLQLWRRGVRLRDQNPPRLSISLFRPFVRI